MDAHSSKLRNLENENEIEKENNDAANLSSEKEMVDVTLSLVQQSNTGASTNSQINSEDHRIQNPSDLTTHDQIKELTNSSFAASDGLIEREQSEQNRVLLDVPSETRVHIDNNNATGVAINALSHDATPGSNPINSTSTDNFSRLKDVKSLSQSKLSSRAKTFNVWGTANVNNTTLADPEQMGEFDDSGTPDERAAFMSQLEAFHREKALDFKAPKFYGEPLNCLKLWRAVIRLGGYDVVTASKLWRQVGESFHPPKTCTTVSWTFRNFYEKALLEYEKNKREIGELHLPAGSFHQTSNIEKEATAYQGSGSGRARRDAAARAMQGWHAQRLIGYGEVAEPNIKDKNLNSAAKREKNLKSLGMINKRIPSIMEHTDKGSNVEGDKQLVTAIADIGPPADWVKINVRQTKDCFEVYVLVPGLLREEVRVQSDPAGRLVITGEPEQIENPWGITPFKKVVTLPARIDALHTSAVVSLHGRLFVRVPFE